MTQIPEEKLNIPGNYQYKALKSRNVLLSNWHNNKMVAVRSLIGSGNDLNLLDIGAGSGIFEYLYAKDFASITVVDHHKKAIKFMDKNFRQNNINNVEIKNISIGEISKLGSEKKYDVVLMLDVIEHIDDADVSNLLSYVKKILTHDGIFIVTTPNYKGTWPAVEFLAERSGLIPRISGVQHINCFDKKSFLRKFSECGYQNVFLSTINTYSFLFPNKSVSEKLVSAEMKYSLPFGNLLLGAFKANNGNISPRAKNK